MVASWGTSVLAFEGLCALSTLLWTNLFGRQVVTFCWLSPVFEYEKSLKFHFFLNDELLRQWLSVDLSQKFSQDISRAIVAETIFHQKEIVAETINGMWIWYKFLWAISLIQRKWYRKKKIIKADAKALGFVQKVWWWFSF